MTKKKILLIAGIVCLLACLCVVLVTCSGGSGNGPAEPSASQGTVGTEEITYTIEITNKGGLYLKDVGIFVYADSTLQELVWFDRTNAEGKMSFVALESDNYVAVLNDIPTGYASQEYYPLTGAETKIVLEAATMSEGDELPTYKLGDMVMDFTVTGTDGTEYKLSELFEGKKAVVLNFWYIECQPCKAEFPYLQEAYEKYSEDIALIGMNPINTDADAIAAFQKEMGITFPLVACGQEWEQIMQLTAYPTTVVIDRFGNICLVHRGSVDKTETFERVFEYFTAEDYEQKLLGGIDEIPSDEEEGTEENPQEMAGLTTFDVEVDPGKESFIEIYRVTGMYMSVSAKEEFYLLYDGKKYESEDGKLGLIVTTGDNYTPSTFGFGNPGKEKLTVKVTFSYLKGTYGNPHTLNLGEFTAKVEPGNDQGVYYIYNAKEDGALMVQYLSGTSGVECGLTLYNLDTGAYRTVDEDGGKDDKGVATVGVEIHKGDKVQLIVAALPDEEFKYPGGTFKLNALLGTVEDLNKNKTPKQDYTVTVVDTEGKPVSDVSLSLMVKENPVTLKTDSKGIATVNLPVENYTLTLTVPAGYTCETTEYTLTKEKPSCTVTLTPKVVVKHDYVVKVLNDAGAPLAGVMVIQGEVYAETDASGNAVFKDLVEFAYTVDVVAPSGYLSSQTGYTFPEGKWEMTVKLEKELIPGTADCPIEISEYPFTIERIDPEQELHYKLSNAGGMDLAFYGGEGAYVIYNGKTYGPDFGGNVAVPLAQGDGQSVIFGNSAAEAKKYNISLQHSVGSQQNPKVVSDLSSLSVALIAGDTDGYFYSWTPDENLDVTLQGTQGSVTVTVGEKTVSGNLADGVSFNAVKGAKTVIQVTAQPDASGNYPAADITVTGTLVKSNSAANPELLTDISRVHLVLPAGKPQGHYYKWIADGEGSVAFRFETVTPGVVGTIVLKVGENTVTMTGDQVAVDVAEGDEVLIQVTTDAAAADVVFGGGFVLGCKANPEVLTSIDSVHTVLATQDADGYYYQWTATETGMLIFPQGTNTDVNLFLSNGSNSADFTQGKVDENGERAAMLAVNAGDVVTIQVISRNGAAVDATFVGRVRLPNSAENPIDISVYPFETQKIENGTPVYYRLNGVQGKLLVIRDADAFAVCGETTYPAVDGVVTVPVTSEALVVAIGNNGTEGKSFRCETEYPVGSRQNPEVVTSINQLNVQLSADNADGYFYQWQVPGNGVATFSISSISAQGVTADIVLTVNGTSKSLSQDGISGVLTADLQGGDQVSLQILAVPAADAQIVVTGNLDQNPNGEENPAIISNITQTVDVELAAGDADGYYYAWTADHNVTVKFTLSDVPDGIDASVNLKCGEKTGQLENGVASIALKKGEKVLVQVISGGEAAQMKLNAETAYDLGTVKNPAKITDITAPILADLEAGDDDGYHYLWVNNIDDGTVSFTVNGGLANIKVNGTAVTDVSNVTVKKDDEVIIQLIATEDNGVYPAAQITATGNFAYALGSKQNPIVVNDRTWDTEQLQPGQTVYFELNNADGMVLGVTSGIDGCLIYGDDEYASGVTIQGEAQLVAIRNDGTEACAYTLSWNYPLGTEQNPEPIADITQIEIIKTLDAENPTYYYKMTVDFPGAIKLTRQTSLWFTYTFTVNGASVTANESNKAKTVNVVAGDVVVLKLSKLTSYTTADVHLTGGITYTQGSIRNPKAITSTFRYVGNALDTNGYYFTWTSAGEGHFWVRRNGGTSELRIWVNGVEQSERVTATGIAGQVSVYVDEGDVVLLQAMPTTATGKAVNCNGQVGFTAMLGSRTNPEKLESQASIAFTTTLSAGDDNGYHYKFTCPESIETGTLYLSAEKGAAAVIKLTVGDKVATSSNGYVYAKLAAGDVVSILVIAAATPGGYPALTTAVSGGIEEPASDAPASGKIRYTISVTETNNISVTGLKVNFTDESGKSQATPDVVNGEAVVDLKAGTYYVSAMDANGAYYLDSKNVMVTPDANTAELRVTKIVPVDEGSTLKDAYYMKDANDVSQWYAYNVNIGVTEAMVNASQSNYSADNGGNCFFLFTAEVPGTYEFTTDNPDAVISAWNTTNSGFYPITPNYDPATNTFVIEVLETQFTGGNKPTYMIGIKSGPTVSKVKLIIRDLHKVPQDINLMPADNSWYSGYVPATFNLTLGSNQKIVPISDTGSYTVVMGDDGYYHFGSKTGPIVYVNLNYSALSFQQMINPGGATGTAFRRYWMEDGLCVKKEDYTEVMTNYLLTACTIEQGDSIYMLHPMTKDLQYMMEIGGQRWWDRTYNNGAEYIYRDSEGNIRTDVTLNPAWLFACCYVETTG